MTRYLADLWAVLKGDGLALDRTEAALIGAPAGDTVSLYAAIGARHGVLLARVACVVFAVAIQRGHCSAQFPGGRPMGVGNYLRAAVCLLAPAWALVLGWVAWRLG